MGFSSVVVTLTLVLLLWGARCEVRKECACLVTCSRNLTAMRDKLNSCESHRRWLICNILDKECEHSQNALAYLDDPSAIRNPCYVEDILESEYYDVTNTKLLCDHYIAMYPDDYPDVHYETSTDYVGGVSSTSGNATTGALSMSTNTFIMGVGIVSLNLF